MYNTDLPNREELPSSKKLLISTFIAMAVAAVLLVTVVLPAEYGIDPTRIGRVLGLTEMGEIKHELAHEAEEEHEKEAKKAQAKPDISETETVANDASEGKSDEKTVTLKPGEGAEIKLEMIKGAKVKYDWKVSGGVANYDLHGDNAKKDFISYKKGRGVEGDSGEFSADFDGSHGWFWRNRTSSNVTIVLKVNGEFTSIKRVA